MSDDETDLQRVRLLYMRQVKLLTEEQERIRRIVERGRAADPDYLMPKELRQAVGEISTFLARAGTQVTDLMPVDERAVTTEELEAQFRAELIKAARLLTDEQWVELEQARRGR